MVFLCLAALYESWSIPLSVILVVPLGVIGVLLATLLRNYSNDIYFQVGLVTVIGLSAKNAILIIEFAKDLQAEGKSVIAAALEAAHLRFRPIIMTSLAFGLGVVPLFMASGASAASQRAIGTSVLGGLCAYPVAIFLMGKSAGDIAFYAYIVPFLISTGVGAVIAGILVLSLQRSGVLRSMQSSLS